MDYIGDLYEFLRIDTTSAKGKGEEGAKFLKDYMESHGIDVRLLRDKAKNPYVYGEINVGAKSTLLIYNHYDVQPAEPLDKWITDPFNPIEKDGKIYARGVADDKGTLMARLQKIISLMKEKKLKINVKFIYEGEEEIGSPNIDSFLNNYGYLLKSNYILWEGSGRGSDGSPQIVLGAKGILYVELRAKTEKDLHSSYAPIVENPIWKLVYFLNSLRSKDGKINIEGFYDNIKWLTSDELKYLRGDKKEMEKALGQEIKYEGFMKKLIEEPTCNIAGIYGGYTGEGSKTIVPSYAFVKIDFRLVPNQDPDVILQKLQTLASKQGIEVVVYGKVKPYRTSINSEISKALIESAKEVYKVDPIVLPNAAGTGPMESFARILNNNQIADGIGVGHVGSNAHSFNENIYKDDYFKAMNWLEAFLQRID